MKKSRVAIITRTKDRHIFMKRAADSILSQTFQDWIWVIVNDGGEKTDLDDLIKLKSEKLNGRVKLIHNEKNFGMEKSSNIGIKSVDSEYIIIHDDDDTWESNFLETTVNFLDNKLEYGGVVTHSNLVLEKIEDNNVKIISVNPFNENLKFISLHEMAIKNLYAPISFLFRRSCMEKVGLFNEKFEKLGDYEFNLRFLSEFDIGLITEKLANYHHRTESNSNYANSVINSNRYKSNMEYDVFLRNYLLRKDLKENKVGIGFFVNLVKIVDNVNSKKNNYIEEFDFEEFKSKKILFYGAGTSAEKFIKIHLPKLKKINVLGLLDQNAKIWGENIHGYEIFPPNKIKELNPDIIIPTVVNKAFVMPFIENLIKENSLNCEIHS